MKKISILLGIFMFMFFSLGFSAKEPKVKKTKSEKKIEAEMKKANKKTTKVNNKFKKEMKSYELEAVIKTNKGNISLFLYPEAAPINVANFVYLAKNNFYKGLKFHRIIPNVLVQGGDPLGTGMGGTGYNVNDEIVDWLNFENNGVLAMANNGENTNSSQFFITVSPLRQLDEKYTIIGEVISRDDLSVVRVLRQDDVIEDIEIRGKKVDEFLNNFTEEVKEWDSILKNK